MAGHEAEQNNELTVIGRGTTIRGEVDFDQGARILGVFEGKIRSQGEVQIGETAECRAEVDAAKVRIEGRLEGNVMARDRLHLSETANMVGDICATLLHVDEGATFVGHCRVGADALESQSSRTSAAASGAASGAGATPARQAAETAPARKTTSPLTVEVPGDGVDFKPPWRDADKSDAVTTASASTEAAPNGTA